MFLKNMKILLIYFIFFSNYLFIIDCFPNKLNDFIQNRKLEDDERDRLMHPKLDFSDNIRTKEKVIENFFKYEAETNYWYENSYKSLKNQLKKKLNENVAKNVIFFLGDGMSLATLFAARIYQGQRDGKNGEDNQLAWESFPYSGLSKTWCIDKQVPDSACTSTAYMTGVKTKYGTVGLNGHVIRGDCKTQNNTANHVESYLKWAQDKGKATGIITTTRITHASPAGGYAHVADRNWESDADVIKSIGSKKSSSCMDIATQLITQNPGKDFKVILGGGRREFLPNTTVDEEGDRGRRKDGKNLIKSWISDKESRNSTYLYSWNRTTLKEVIEHPEEYDYILGLYESSHISYNLEKAKENDDPSLAEMTEAAIKVLNSSSSNGFILFIEGGRIDHAHHDTYATLALDETVELAKAVQIATKYTSVEDTLIIVTSDHAHTMSVSGYSARGTKINGPNTKIGDDHLLYMTLSYANGPGYRKSDESGSRHNISHDNIDDVRYQFPSMVPLDAATHSGEDVAVFASGPWAHLFTGTIEQNDMAHFIAYASCLAPKSACSSQLQQSNIVEGLNKSSHFNLNISLIFLNVMINVIINLKFFI